MERRCVGDHTYPGNCIARRLSKMIQTWLFDRILMTPGAVHPGLKTGFAMLPAWSSRQDLARSETCFRAACSLHRNVRKSIQATALVIAEPSRHHRGMPLKILVSCVLTLAAAVAVLRSDWIPWRIVSRTELQRTMLRSLLLRKRRLRKYSHRAASQPWVSRRSRCQRRATPVNG